MTAPTLRLLPAPSPSPTGATFDPLSPAGLWMIPSPASPVSPPSARDLTPDEIARIGRRDRRALEKSISPVDHTSIHLYGVSVIDKADPILRLLALSDEREYKRMIDSDTAIGGAVEQRISGVISAGSEVELGPSRSKIAVELRNFAIRFLKHLPRFGTLRRECLRTIFYGWSPLELQWKMDMNLGRPGQWGVVNAVSRKPWHYYVTSDGYLVRGALAGHDPDVYDSPSDQIRYRIFTAGSTESPYGEAYLRRVWLLFFLSKKFERMSAQQMQRALGLVKVKLGPQRGRVPSATLDSELERVLVALNSYNILWEQAGTTIEFVPTPGITRNTREILDYWNTQKRVAIVGQNLSSEVRAGSYAATQTHVDEVLRSYIEADAREEQAWWNDVLELAISLNYGEQDLLDLPRWRSNLFREPVDLEATKTYFAMGGVVDARRMAERASIPALLPEDDTPQPLQKQEQTDTARGRGRPKKGEEDGREEERDRGRDTGSAVYRSSHTHARIHSAVLPGDEDIPDLGDDADLTDPDSVLSAHYARIRDMFLAANPDPSDPKAARPRSS